MGSRCVVPFSVQTNITSTYYVNKEKKLELEVWVSSNKQENKSHLTYKFDAF